MSNFRAGTYNARVAATSHGISDKGKDYIVVSFAVDFSDGTSETISKWLYFASDENSRISMEDLRKCGWDGADIIALNGMVGHTVDIVLAEESYDGKVSLKVKYINVPGTVRVENPMGEAQKQSFAARMRGPMMAAAQAGGAKPAQRTKPAPVPPQNGGGGAKPWDGQGADPGGDDIPFAHCFDTSLSVLVNPRRTRRCGAPETLPQATSASHGFAGLASITRDPPRCPARNRASCPPDLRAAGEAHHMTKSIDTIIKQPTGDDIYAELAAHGPLVALTILLDAVRSARGQVEAERDAASEKARACTAALSGARDAVSPPKAKATRSVAVPASEFTEEEQGAHVAAVSGELATGARTLGALATATGLGRDALTVALARLRKAGMATCTGRTWSRADAVGDGKDAEAAE